MLCTIFFFFFCAGLKKGLEFKLKYPADTLAWQKKTLIVFIYNSPDLGWWGGFVTGPQAVLVEDPWSRVYNLDK